MNKWIDSIFPFVEVESLAESKRSGVAIKPNDFTDRGHLVIHKGDVLENGQLDLSFRNSRHVSRGFAETKKSGLINSDFLVISLRDLVPLAPQLGLICILPSDKSALLAQGTYAFKINLNKVESRYLSILSNCEEFRALMRIKSVGSTQVHLRSTEFFEIAVPLPEIKEQARIINIIDAVENNIRETKNILSKLDQIKTGTMQDLFTRGIDEKGKLRPSYKDAPTLYKDSELGMIPENWGVKKLGAIAKVIDGTHFTPVYTEHGIPFLRVTDIVNMKKGFKDIKYISSEEHQVLIKRCNPKKGDLLYSKNGTIGIPKVIDWDFEFSIFVSLALISIEDKKISNYFLEYFLGSSLIKEQIRRRVKQGTVINLHLEEIREFDIIIPPSDETIKIVEHLNQLSEQIILEEKQLIKLQRIKKGLMQDLLTGRVRVKV